MLKFANLDIILPPLASRCDASFLTRALLNHHSPGIIEQLQATFHLSTIY